jgi:hypothetical protein
MIFLPVFVDVQAGRVGRLVVVHQKHGTLLHQEEYADARAMLSGMQSACSRRTLLEDSGRNDAVSNVIGITPSA